MNEPIPTYCTPEDVAETLDLPSENGDNYGAFAFTDLSHPSYKQVCKMICANEDIIDRRLKRSWRVNYVKDYTLNIPKYWQDENAWRTEYYRQGGNMIQLRKDILPWDPTPKYSEVLECTHVESAEGLEEGKPGVIGKKKVMVESIIPDELGGYDVEYYKEIYGGDRLEVRTNTNIWLDMSNHCIDHEATSSTDEFDYSDFESVFAADVQNNTFWFDRTNGRLFIKRRVYMPAAQGMRITYRYGTPDEDIPAAINRLACMLTAIDVINMQAFHVRLGVGGDITGIKDAMINGWKERCAEIYASYQRPGSVYSLMR